MLVLDLSKRPDPLQKNIKTLVKEISENGPVVWDKEQIDKKRFRLTDVLDDIKYRVSREEQIASAACL